MSWTARDDGATASQPGAAERGADRAAHAPGAAPLVRALRLAGGAGCWPQVERCFQAAYGAGDGTAAACLLRILLQGLALGARRKLRLGLLGAPELTADERALLQMIGAGRQDEVLLEATTVWLVRPDARAAVASAAAGLGELLAGRAPEQHSHVAKAWRA